MTYLSQRRKSEARSRIMLSAGGWGGRRGVGAGERGHRDGRGVKEPTKSPRRSWRGRLTRPQAAGPQDCFIAGVYSRERGRARLPSPHPSARPARLLTRSDLRGIKEKTKGEPVQDKAMSPAPRQRGALGPGAGKGGQGRHAGRHGRHGTLAPGIYRRARDRFRNTARTIRRAAAQPNPREPITTAAAGGASALSGPFR